MLHTYPLPVGQLRNLPKVDFSFVIATAEPSWYEQAHKRRQWLPANRNNAGKSNRYVSQAFFKRPQRRKINVAAISHSWIDLDTYNVPELKELKPDRVAQVLLDRIDDDGGIRPTAIISSGRGLYGFWAYAGIVPAAAAATVEAVNKAMVRKYADFGADARAVDSTRVLRIPGTINSRSGCRVDVLYNSETSYRFGDLADEILPYSRAELSELRQRREARRASASRYISQATRRFDRSSWGCGVVADMQHLADIRWGGIVPRGQRDIWIFVAAVHLAWTCRPGEIADEVAALAIAWGIDPEWIDRGHYLHSVIDRSIRAACGERIEWLGKPVDPRYRFNQNTLIEWLKIEPDEMADLSRLFNRDEKNRRSRDRRAIDAAIRNDRRSEAVASFLRGDSIDEITTQFGIDSSTLLRWRRKFEERN